MFFDGTICVVGWRHVCGETEIYYIYITKCGVSGGCKKLVFMTLGDCAAESLLFSYLFFVVLWFSFKYYEAQF